MGGRGWLLIWAFAVGDVPGMLSHAPAFSGVLGETLGIQIRRIDFKTYRRGQISRLSHGASERQR